MTMWRTINPDRIEDIPDTYAVIEAEWDEAEDWHGGLEVPVTLINGERAMLQLSESYILNLIRASVADYLEGKRSPDY